MGRDVAKVDIPHHVCLPPCPFHLFSECLLTKNHLQFRDAAKVHHEGFLDPNEKKKKSP